MSRRLPSCLASVLVVAAFCGLVWAQDAKLVESFAAVRDACPMVYPEGTSSDRGGFSAVLVGSNGLLLTAGHCLSGEKKYFVVMPDGRRFEAVPLGSERRLDCGMMRIVDPPSNLPFVRLGQTTRLSLGSRLFSVGYPGESSPGRGPVLRLGLLGRLRTDRGFLQSTALMEPGDSGGPLFDIEGRLIGIHSNIDRGLDENFDVPVEAFLAFWEELQGTERFEAWKIVRHELGLEVVETSGGLRVSHLAPSGPAACAGVMLGDRVLRLLGKDVETKAAFDRRLRGHLKRSLFEPLTLEVGFEDEVRALTFVSLSSARSAEAVLDRIGESVADPNASTSAPERSVVTVEWHVGDEKAARRISGIITPCGRILTKASEIEGTVTVKTHDGRTLPARMVASDARHDLGLLDVEIEGVGLTASVRFDEPATRVPGMAVFSPVPGSKGERTGVVSTIDFSSRGRLLLGVELARKGRGVVVQRVRDGSPAKRTGLKRGDVLIRIGPKELTTRDELIAFMENLDGPLTLAIEFIRSGEKITAEVTPNYGVGAGPAMHIADRIEGGFSRRRSGFPHVFGHDAPLRADECGGPLLDDRGRMVGVTIARVSRTQCLAIPMFVVREFLAAHPAP